MQCTVFKYMESGAMTLCTYPFSFPLQLSLMKNLCNQIFSFLILNECSMEIIILLATITILILTLYIVVLLVFYLLDSLVNTLISFFFISLPMSFSSFLSVICDSELCFFLNIRGFRRFVNRERWINGKTLSF